MHTANSMGTSAIKTEGDTALQAETFAGFFFLSKPKIRKKEPLI